MRGGFGLAGPVLASVCGVFTAYTAWQPALQQRQEEKQGVNFSTKHNERKEQDTAISQAIISDIKEAGREVTQAPKNQRGFAWGIREALFGPPPSTTTAETPSTPPSRPIAPEANKETQAEAATPDVKK